MEYKVRKLYITQGFTLSVKGLNNFDILPLITIGTLIMGIVEKCCMRDL